MEEYWSKENSLFDYFLFHYFFTLAVLNDEDCKKMYESMPNIGNRNPHLLQQVLLQDFNEQLYDELCHLTSIHKLTYKFSEDASKYTFLQYLLQNK